MMMTMIREGLRAKAEEIQATDAATRAEWEAETELGYPMGSLMEFSLALRALVAEILQALADMPRRTLVVGLIGYAAVVVIAAVWLR